jgi:hypothetical protein
MRKQKATVWCDRSQHEDPRIVAQQKAAKLRAAMEVHGSGRGSVSGSMTARSKIKQASKGTMSQYSPAAMVGGVGGVPMRLSASEVGDEESSEDESHSQYGAGGFHKRSGSGRSSLGSNRRPNGLKAVNSVTSMTRLSSGSHHQYQGNTPPLINGSERSSIAELGENEETPVPSQYQRPGAGNDYFNKTKTGLSGGSGGSGSSGGENTFGSVGALANRGPAPIERGVGTVKTKEDLKKARRGSVDDRAMTMSGGVRLFVANPDADSD